MKRVSALLLALLVTILTWQSGAVGADQIPYLSDPDQRFMIGEEYGLQGKPAKITKDDSGRIFRLADTIVLFLVRPDLPEVTIGTSLVPNVIEIRYLTQAAGYLNRPLRWVLWSSRGDGIADLKAQVIGFEGGDLEKPIFAPPKRINVNLLTFGSKNWDIQSILNEVPVETTPTTSPGCTTAL